MSMLHWHSMMVEPDTKASSTYWTALMPMAARICTISAEREQAKAGARASPSGMPVHLRYGGVRMPEALRSALYLSQAALGLPLPPHFVAQRGSNIQQYLWARGCSPMDGKYFEISQAPKNLWPVWPTRRTAPSAPSKRKRQRSWASLTFDLVRSVTVRTA